MLTRKLIITFIALFTAISPFLADWNHTHIFNDAWPPHAKFHNAQTMMFGLLLGLSSVITLWVLKNNDLRRLRAAAHWAAL
jgi:hypothetical protein